MKKITYNDLYPTHTEKIIARMTRDWVRMFDAGKNPAPITNPEQAHGIFNHECGVFVAAVVRPSVESVDWLDLHVAARRRLVDTVMHACSRHVRGKLV